MLIVGYPHKPLIPKPTNVVNQLVFRPECLFLAGNATTDKILLNTIFIGCCTSHDTEMLGIDGKSKDRLGMLLTAFLVIPSLADFDSRAFGWQRRKGYKVKVHAWHFRLVRPPVPGYRVIIACPIP